jgi:ribosomal protein S21
MPMEVYVRDNDVNAAIRVLKKMQREGAFRKVRLRRFYEKTLRTPGARRLALCGAIARRCASGSNAKTTDSSWPRMR